jgi:hypothetical protein
MEDVPVAKALTICQPYAHLIMRGDKRIENRTWPTSYRGLLYIHAGKSRDWLDIWNMGGEDFDAGYDIPLRLMSFGAMVAVARLVDCVRIEHGAAKYPWMDDHEHAEGPWCWILESVTPIGPWPWRGAQGLWDFDEAELGRVANQELGVPEHPTVSPTQEPR